MESNSTNSKSVAALTLGILSIIIPIFGILLGVIGIYFSRASISEINSTNEAGRGFAIAGGICSIVGLALQLFFILLYSMFIVVSV